MDGPGATDACSGSAPHDTSAKAEIAEKAVAAKRDLFLGIAGIDAPTGGLMATATLKPATRAPRSRFRTARNVALAVVAIGVLWFVWNWSSIKGQAQLGAAYGAHVACSCRYIAGRDLKSCETDFEPGMELVSVSDDPENKRITASVPFLAEAVAERRGLFGCVQLNEAEIDAL